MARLTVPAIALLLLYHAAATSGAAPALFREALFPPAVSQAAAVSSLQLPQDLELPGTKYVEPKLRTGDYYILLLLCLHQPGERL
jgi:hypothetical protein